MRKFFLLLLSVFVSWALNAQTRNTKNYIDNIKADTSYYYGESPVLNSEDKAYTASVVSLYENIADNYSGNILYFGSEDIKEYFTSIIKTFEDEIDECTFQYSVVEDYVDEKFSYFTYIKRDDFRKMCYDRNVEIQQYANNGLRYENELNQLDDAMRCYYWGMMSCVAHPDGAVIKINVNNTYCDAYNWFYNSINNILASFEFSVSDDDPGELTNEGMSLILNVKSESQSYISNLQFRYYNGIRYESAKVVDNRATVKLYDDLDVLDIKIEYDFVNDAVGKPEIRKILENVDKVTFKSNVMREINIAPYKSDLKRYDVVDYTESDTDVDYGSNYLSIMKEIETAFRSRNYSKVRRFFDADGLGMLDTLTKYGKLSVIGPQNYEFIDYQNTVICRGIVMNFDFKNHAPFTREVVFRFDKNTNLISSIAFRLSSRTENDIRSRTMWPLDNRMALINFLEDYQTAYCLKRYDYLRSIFSDDALIIVGHVVTKDESPMSDRMYLNLPGKRVELIKSDKKTYFNKLSRVFKLQEFIDIRFTEIDIARQMSTEDEELYNGGKRYEDIYGVRVLQEYKSSTYGDVGYLFLLVDFRKEYPVIHVRSWQPEKTDVNDVIGLKDLR